MAPEEERPAVLEGIYRDNIARLEGGGEPTAMTHGIRLYRLSSALFPMSDLPGDDTGLGVLDALSRRTGGGGRGVQGGGRARADSPGSVSGAVERKP